MIRDEADELAIKLFDSLKNIYQNNLQLMRSSEFVLDYVQLLYYKCHQVNLNRGGSYIESSDQIKNKKAAINPINEKEMFSIHCNSGVKLWRNKKDLQRITKPKPFINKYNWERINYPLEKDDWKKIEKINETIRLNFLYTKKEKNILLIFKT